jgi:hypothetical protein
VDPDLNQEGRGGLAKVTRLGLKDIPGLKDPKIHYLTNLKDSEPVKDIASNSRT